MDITFRYKDRFMGKFETATRSGGYALVDKMFEYADIMVEMEEEIRYAIEDHPTGRFYMRDIAHSIGYDWNNKDVRCQVMVIFREMRRKGVLKNHTKIWHYIHP